MTAGGAERAGISHPPRSVPLGEGSYRIARNARHIHPYENTKFPELGQLVSGHYYSAINLIAGSPFRADASSPARPGAAYPPRMGRPQPFTQTKGA